MHLKLFVALLYFIHALLFVQGQYTYAYLGCFADGNPRALPEEGGESPDNSIEYCVNLCGQNDYRYAGLQQGEFCYCGDDGYDLHPAPPNGEESCTDRCTGNSSQICGGFYINSVYEVVRTSTSTAYSTLSDVTMPATSSDKSTPSTLTNPTAPAATSSQTTSTTAFSQTTATATSSQTTPTATSSHTTPTATSSHTTPIDISSSATPTATSATKNLEEPSKTTTSTTDIHTNSYSPLTSRIPGDTDSNKRTTSPRSGDEVNINIYIGCAVGALVVCIIIILVIVLVIRKRRINNNLYPSQAENPKPSDTVPMSQKTGHSLIPSTARHHVTARGDVYTLVNKVKAPQAPADTFEPEYYVLESVEDNVYMNADSNALYANTTAAETNNIRSVTDNPTNHAPNSQSDPTADHLVMVDSEIYE